LDQGPTPSVRAGGHAARAALLAILVWVGTPARSADEAAVPPRFLIVYGQDSALTVNIQTAAGIQVVLSQALPNREIYSEHLDSARFPDPAHAERLAEMMVAKYRDRPMSAVLAANEAALDFVLRHRPPLRPARRWSSASLARTSRGASICRPM
jgi:hypothetical protein